MSREIDAVFLDRDGTICEERGPVRTWEELRVFPYTVPVLRRIRSLGLRIVVVSNQAAIARGLATYAEVDSVNERLMAHLGNQGAKILDSLFCPHHPEGTVPEFTCKCWCRKPNPGMLLQAAERFGIRLEQSIMIGDNISDLQAGLAAGCATSILLRTGHGHSFSQAYDGPVLDSLCDLADWLEH